MEKRKREKKTEKEGKKELSCFENPSAINNNVVFYLPFSASLSWLPHNQGIVSIYHTISHSLLKKRGPESHLINKPLPSKSLELLVRRNTAREKGNIFARQFTHCGEKVWRGLKSSDTGWESLGETLGNVTSESAKGADSTFSTIR